MTALETLESRAEELEKAHYGAQSDESSRRALKAVQALGLYSARTKWVPEAYYSWPLAQRAACLGAPSVHHLCKSLLLDNKKAPAGRPHDPTFPKFVLVILQYAATLDTKLLVNAVRALRPVKERFDASHFDFRIAAQADNDRLTGYVHNSVTPFGMAQPEEVTILLAQDIVPLHFFWMGGGHVHCKLGLSVADCLQGLRPHVVAISKPRSLDELEGGDDEVPTGLVDDYQAAMDRRRNIEEEVPVDPSQQEQAKGNVKVVETALASDLEAKMQCRREAEEKGEIQDWVDTNFAAKAASTKGVLGSEWGAMLEKRKTDLSDSSNDPAKTKKETKSGKNREWEAMLAKRQAQPSTEISLSPKTTAVNSNLSPEMQAIMDRRRKTEAGSNAAFDYLKPSPQSTKTNALCPEMQAIMDKRRAGASSGVSPSFVKAKLPSPKTVLNPEVQAMMDKRKNAQSINLTALSKPKEELKGFEINPEVKAAMERRRKAQESGVDVSESAGSEKDTAVLKGFEIADSQVKQVLEARRKQQEAGIDVSKGVGTGRDMETLKGFEIENAEVKAALEKRRQKGDMVKARVEESIAGGNGGEAVVADPIDDPGNIEQSDSGEGSERLTI